MQEVIVLVSHQHDKARSGHNVANLEQVFLVLAHFACSSRYISQLARGTAPRARRAVPSGLHLPLAASRYGSDLASGNRRRWTNLAHNEPHNSETALNVIGRDRFSVLGVRRLFEQHARLVGDSWALDPHNSKLCKHLLAPIAR